MGKTITIDPVTRIEGHSKITLKLDDAGHVSDARFHVTQFRGFEKFCEGRPFYEMPALMARICGICPVSHLVASAKACDAILAVRIPETAAMLRQVLNLAQMIQSHALSFFYLSSPDLLLGFDSDPAKRNIFGLLREEPAGRPRRHPPPPLRPAGHRDRSPTSGSTRRGSSRAASTRRSPPTSAT